MKWQLHAPRFTICFEQKQPEAALALAHPLSSPWPAGIRGTADLLLNHKAEAEKEFTALHAGLVLQVGEYLASRTVLLFQILASSYADHSQQVLANWQQLAGVQRNWFEHYGPCLFTSGHARRCGAALARQRGNSTHDRQPRKHYLGESSDLFPVSVLFGRNDGT
jgi:hypothetical protein